METEESTTVGQATEASALLRTTTNESAIDPKWAAEVAAGREHTTWRKEGVIIVKAAIPLVMTGALQYSLTVINIASVGHLGKTELGGVSLGAMTGNISGMWVFMGFASGLDTLCSQAYGAGRKELLGLHLQRMVLFFATLMVPIALLWVFSYHLLILMVPDEQVVVIASQYLRILIFGLPAFATHECGKRYMQAQGLFTAPTYVFAVCVPICALMNWIFVWKLEWGYVGAPIATAITYNLLALCLFLYAYFIAGRECWGGFTTKAFSNWGSMLRLSFPGFIMTEAEVFAFEILVLASSHISTSALAAQSVLNVAINLLFQMAWPLAVVGSVRVGNLVGAGLPEAAQLASKVTRTAAAMIGAMNGILLLLLRYKIPHLFTTDSDVIAQVGQTLVVCAAFQLFDSLASACNGVLRGVGRQKFGGYSQLFAWYVVAMPISMTTAFVSHWGLRGLWFGIAVGLASVCVVVSIYIRYIDWDRCVEAAKKRNAQD